eukprot:gene258-341_t
MIEPLDGKYLGAITSDFVLVADKLREAAYVINQQGHYGYPVFIASTTSVNLGPLFVDQGEMGNQLYYYVTYLEALVQAQLIAAERQEDFKSCYKNVDEFCCLLVIDAENGICKLVSIPYPED